MYIKAEGKKVILDTEKQREKFIKNNKDGKYTGEGNVGEKIEVQLIQGVGFELRRIYKNNEEFEGYNSKGERNS